MSDDSAPSVTNYRTEVMWVRPSGFLGGFWSVRHYCLTCRAQFDSTARTGGKATIADLAAHAEAHRRATSAGADHRGTVKPGSW